MPLGLAHTCITRILGDNEASRVVAVRGILQHADRAVRLSCIVFCLCACDARDFELKMHNVSISCLVTEPYTPVAVFHTVRRAEVPPVNMRTDNGRLVAQSRRSIDIKEVELPC
jgi:hypothetical protein